ncbi:MAG: HPr family phosphocarrier protein [Eubacteriales bacterium]
MKKALVEVQLANGLDARSVAMLVQVATQYSSHIYIQVDEKKVNAKSIMGMMTLALNPGDSLEIEATGDDELTAVEAISAYLAGKSE